MASDEEKRPDMENPSQAFFSFYDIPEKLTFPEFS